MKQDELPQLGVIAKLQLVKGDILVINCPGKLSAREHENMLDTIGAVLDRLGLSHSDVPTLVLEEGITISLLSAGEIVFRKHNSTRTDCPSAPIT